MKKISYAVLTIFLALSAIFFAVRLTPGDPVERILGPEATTEELVEYRKQLGLDKSLTHQYINYLKGCLSGNFGESLFKQEDVVGLIKQRAKPTIIVALMAILISSFVGTFLGVISAYFKSNFIDGGIRLLTLISLSIPVFSLAPLLVLLFALELNLLPVSEWGGVEHAILPILTLVIPLSSVLARVTRNAYLEERSAPWVQVARSKGLGNVDISYRILRICLPTILNIIAIQLSVVLAGTIITETIFDIPGMGMLLFEGIQNRDYPVVQGVIVYSTVIYILLYFLVDYLSAKLDPRISQRTEI